MAQCHEPRNLGNIGLNFSKNSEEKVILARVMYWLGLGLGLGLRRRMSREQTEMLKVERLKQTNYVIMIIVLEKLGPKYKVTRRLW